MMIRCVVACHGCDGPTMPCLIACTQEEYDEGKHYEMAEEVASDKDYDGPMVVFDENDGPAWLFKNVPAIDE